MKTETLYQALRLPNQPDTKLVLLVLDGIGDIATAQTNYLTLSKERGRLTWTNWLEPRPSDE